MVGNAPPIPGKCVSQITNNPPDKSFGGQCPPYVYFKNQILVLYVDNYLLNFRSKKAIICDQAEVAATAS